MSELNNSMTNADTTLTNINTKVMAAGGHLARIRAILSNMDVSADQLHVELVDLIVCIHKDSLQSITANTALVYVFESQTKGADRRQIASWLQDNTPIRIKWKDNGQFDKVIVSERAIKAARKANKPVWNLDGLAASHWWGYEGVTNKPTKAPELDKAVEQLGRILARASHELLCTSDDEELTLGDANRQVVRALMDKLQEETLLSEMRKVQAKDSHKEWATKRDETRALERQRELEKAHLDAVTARQRQEEAQNARTIVYNQYTRPELVEIRDGIKDGLIDLDDLPMTMRHEDIEYVTTTAIH